MKVEGDSQASLLWKKKGGNLKKKVVGLLENGKEDKEGKFQQTKNCKQKFNQSVKPYKE